MKLGYKDISAAVLGAAYTEETDGKISFHRFTKEQEAYYLKTQSDFYEKTFATAGIRLYFKTNSKSLKLAGEIVFKSSRKYYSADVFVNGKMVDSINKYEGLHIENPYHIMALPAGSFSKETDLGEGDKVVEIYLPWSASLSLSELSLDDGAYFTPLKKNRSLLAFGDSITHGYDSLYTSAGYVQKLADRIGAELYNKAIGGEVFCPDLAKLKDEFTPDLITVAYGTNDFSHKTKQEFRENCKNFYENLRKLYPETPIFAITPIPRKDSICNDIFGKHSDVEPIIAEIVAKIPNVILISGYDLFPCDENLFGDLVLHPNDKGFTCYAENLLKKMEKYL